MRLQRVPCSKGLFPVQVLIADFFFVCAALAWLVAGAGAKTVLNNSVSIAHPCIAMQALNRIYYACHGMAPAVPGITVSESLKC